MFVKLCEGMVVEDLGGEYLVCDPKYSQVHRVSAEGAPWLAELLSGETIEVSGSQRVSKLLHAGLLQEVSGFSTSRRKVLKTAGSAVATIGIATIVLPSAAAAASAPPTTPATTPPATPPARPTSEPVWGFNQGTGVVTIYWESIPESFTYSLSFSPDSGTTVNAGPINSGTTPVHVYTLALNTTVTVTATSATSTTKIRSNTFNRPILD